MSAHRLLALALGLAGLLAAPAAGAGSAGVELRAYPAGLIPGLRGEMVLGPDDLFVGQVGYNATERHDWGEHEQESGGGIGLGAGWLHRIHGAWWLGARLDSWWLEIDWEDPARRGTTSVQVLQPTLTGNYRWGPGSWHVEWSLAAGMEINLDTRGEAVGEGFIVLAGAGFLFGL